jgi:hypothetical protein
MEKIQMKALKTAMDILGSLDCKYAIIDPTGVKHGELEVVQTKKPNKSGLEYGVQRKYVAAYLENLPVGKIVVIPTTPEMTMDRVQASACNFMARSLGLEKNQYFTNRQESGVAVFRSAWGKLEESEVDDRTAPFDFTAPILEDQA